MSLRACDEDRTLEKLAHARRVVAAAAAYFKHSPISPIPFCALNIDLTVDPRLLLLFEPGELQAVGSSGSNSAPY